MREISSGAYLVADVTKDRPSLHSGGIKTSQTAKDLTTDKRFSGTPYDVDRIKKQSVADLQKDLA